MAVLFPDLDDFKRVNDTLGHLAGDALLRLAAQRIAGCLRKSDTGARLGGDEFAILVTSLAHEDDALRIAEKMLTLLREPLSLKGAHQAISASVGIATFPRDASSAEELLKRADAAMYQAKAAGRDRVACWQPGLRGGESAERASLEARLREALEGGELVLHYQPVVDVGRGRVVGAEALLRWRHPELGLVLPGEFLSIAENTQLIVPIGEWVLREACTQAARWQALGFPGFRIAVNVSSQQFQPGEFVAKVRQTLLETGLRSDCLELELTERSLLHDSERTLAQFAMLKGLGVRMAIDDFGTGYSALAYLKQLPVDTLKIDQSFVRALATDPADATITSTIVQMAHALNLSTIGEGVESVEQMQLLASYGCNRMQGYLFSQPIDADGLGRLLDARPFWWMRGAR
jgi:diguanylate cyclase (GGDEF)-like protein